MIVSRYRYRFWLALPIVHHRDTPVPHRYLKDGEGKISKIGLTNRFLQDF